MQHDRDMVRRLAALAGNPEMPPDGRQEAAEQPALYRDLYLSESLIQQTERARHMAFYLRCFHAFRK